MILSIRNSLNDEKTASVWLMRKGFVMAKKQMIMKSFFLLFIVHRLTVTKNMVLNLTAHDKQLTSLGSFTQLRLCSCRTDKHQATSSFPALHRHLLLSKTWSGCVVLKREHVTETSWQHAGAYHWECWKPLEFHTLHE